MTVIKASVRVLLMSSLTQLALIYMEPCFADEQPEVKEQSASTKATIQSDKTDKTDEKKDQPITVEQANLSESQNLYLGNKFSQKYHLKGCHFAQIADPGNIFPFASCKEAIKSNYRPCNWCLPKWQKFVKGQIIGLPIIRKADTKRSPSQ